MIHWADNYAAVGRIRTASPQVTETRRMKSAVKTKARKTNRDNQASFGHSGSLLKNNMEVEAVMELARHLDETGLH